jgi:hypothetical protein
LLRSFDLVDADNLAPTDDFGVHEGSGSLWGLLGGWEKGGFVDGKAFDHFGIVFFRGVLVCCRNRIVTGPAESSMRMG